MGRSLAVLVILAACGGNDAADGGDDDSPDAPLPDSQPPATCGNGVVEGDEQCDDGDTETDNVCDATCRSTCGNGSLDDGVGETCDTGIATGSGVCPSTCDDSDACTADVLEGTGCIAACVNAAITDAIDGDGCCPDGANANTDADCGAECGNGILETGELCDTAITAGSGACPTTCSDGIQCTTDALVSGGTCQAQCTTTPITAPANNDGCCPAGADPTTDNDCVGCGNGFVDNGETCDTAITSGAGACPTTCSDGLACTTDTLANGSTCQAACVFPPITMPINNDGCCPTGANANTDNNCPPSCGNSVTEMGEACDDGNQIDTDACRNNCTLGAPPPTAYRFTDLDLRDPHVFVNFVGCRDVTDTQLVGFSVNNELQTSIQQDGTEPPDGFLDLSPTLVFRPFSSTAATTPVELHFARCTATNTTCTPGADAPALATATNAAAGTCLAPLAGTTRPYSPAIATPAGPCFSTNPIPAVTINLGGIPIRLSNVRLGGTYVGTTGISNGLMMGFISEADANTTIIPASFPLVGGQPLSALLAGGSGACPNYSDKETVGGVVGWWFYLNFPAARVPWTD